MGLETATYISQLVSTNPVGGTDDYATADDHLRLIKAVLQAQFPNFSASAVNTTVGELNTLDGITATTAELNKLAGFTGLVADLNILSGAAAGGLTAAELVFLANVTSDVQTQLNGKAASSHAHAASDVTSGTFADARIAATNVTQHVASINHNALLNYVANEHIRWDLTGVDDVHIDRIPVASIDHDALSGFVANEHIDHSTVSISAGTGMSGGGTIAANRTLNFDPSGLATLIGNSMIETDSFVIDDGGTPKKVRLQDAGMPVITESTTGRTIASTDANKYIRCTSATAVTITLNTGVGQIGNEIVIEQAGAGQVTVAGTATVNAANGKKTANQYSVIFLKCVAANTWTLGGDATT